jgi:hypothetical protein
MTLEEALGESPVPVSLRVPKFLTEWYGISKSYPLKYCRASLTEKKLRLLGKERSANNTKRSASDFPL